MYSCPSMGEDDSNRFHPLLLSSPFCFFTSHLWQLTWRHESDDDILWPLPCLTHYFDTSCLDGCQTLCWPTWRGLYSSHLCPAECLLLLFGGYTPLITAKKPTGNYSTGDPILVCFSFMFKTCILQAIGKKLLAVHGYRLVSCIGAFNNIFCWSSCILVCVYPASELYNTIQALLRNWKVLMIRCCEVQQEKAGVGISKSSFPLSSVSIAHSEIDYGLFKRKAGAPSLLS